jgi:hypothetical protein
VAVALVCTVLGTATSAGSAAAAVRAWPGLAAVPHRVQDRSLAATAARLVLHRKAQHGPALVDPGGAGPLPRPTHPLTAAQVGWPLPHGCQAALARRADDRDLADVEPVGKVLPGSVAAIGNVTGGKLAGWLVTPTGAAGGVRRSDCVSRLWHVVATLAPPAVVARVGRFVVFTAPTPTGPQGEVVGYVRPYSVETFTLALSPEGLTDREFAHVVIHELGHLFTVNGSQYIWGSTRGCAPLPAPDGCLRAGRLLSDYITETWPNPIYRSWLDLFRGRPSFDQQVAWWRAHRPEFVTPYASTRPDEDFAESFATWCLGEPAAGAGARQKLVFVGRRPEVAAMRDRCAALR